MPFPASPTVTLVPPDPFGQQGYKPVINNFWHCPAEVTVRSPEVRQSARRPPRGQHLGPELARYRNLELPGQVGKAPSRAVSTDVVTLSGLQQGLERKAKSPSSGAEIGSCRRLERARCWGQRGLIGA